IQVGPQYAATAQAIPPSIHYAALGHVHRPQEIAGAAVRARYAGSLLQLDFSERTHRKEVVLVEASARTPPSVSSVQLASGRRLLRGAGLGGSDRRGRRARGGGAACGPLSSAWRASAPTGCPPPSTSRTGVCSASSGPPARASPRCSTP